MKSNYYYKNNHTKILDLWFCQYLCHEPDYFMLLDPAIVQLTKDWNEDEE